MLRPQIGNSKSIVQRYSLKLRAQGFTLYTRGTPSKIEAGLRRAPNLKEYR